MIEKNNNTYCSDICDVLLSIIIPVYNGEEFLYDCFESVRKATDNISTEIIIVDDGSDDSSPEFCKRYSKQNSNFYYYRKQNGGVSDARNYGISKAKGEYIAFVDSDDIVLPHMYEMMLESVIEYDPDFVACNVARFDSKRFWPAYLQSISFNRNQFVDYCISDSTDYVYDTIVVNKIIKKSFWDSNGLEFSKGYIFEDMPVSFCLYFKSKKTILIHQVCYLWRSRDVKSVSLTQNKNILSHLSNRTSMLSKMFSYFEKNKVDNDTFNRVKNKTLSLDLMMYINKLPELSDEQQLSCIDLINSFLDSYFLQSDFGLLSIADQQKYCYIKSRDIVNLKKTIMFHKKQYNTIRTSECDGEIVADLPDSIFTVPQRNIASEAVLSNPKIKIDDICKNDNGFSLKCYLYYPRIDINNSKQQTIKANIVEMATGNKTELDISYYNNTALTNQAGFVYDFYNDESACYNYDGTGFEVLIDFSKLSIKGVNSVYYISLEYSNRFTKGVIALNSPNALERKVFEKQAFYNDRRLFILSFDFNNVLIIKALSKINYYDNAADSFINAVKPVYSKNHFVKCTVDNRLIYSKNDLLVTIADTTNFAYVSKCSFDGFKLELTVVSSHSSVDRISSSAVLSFFNEYNLKETIISRSRTSFNNGQGQIIFEIDFEDPAVIDLFSKGYHNLHFSFESTNEYIGLIANAELKVHFDKDIYSLWIFSDENNKLSFLFEKKWRLSENTIDKRRFIRKHIYPKYMKLDVNDNYIVFESNNGSDHSGNPKSFYEFISSNYPNYKCIWVLNDTTIPIEGNAIKVRKRSKEYYYYLAVSKYFVINFEADDTFVKRDEQIVIQTMNGTPFEKVGLDNEVRYKSEKQKKAYMKRNTRWDYIISRGSYSSKNDNRWYGFSGRIIKSGFPTTDVRFEQIKKADLKKRLGLPSEKKIILYISEEHPNMPTVLLSEIERMKNKLSDEYVLITRVPDIDYNVNGNEDDCRFVFDYSQSISIDEYRQITDVLITDYSSASFDFISMNKPVFFYLHDCNIEATKRRIDPEFYNLLKNEALQSIDEVIYSLTNIDEYLKSRKRFFDTIWKKYLTYESEHSSESIFNEVFQNNRVGLLNTIKNAFNNRKNLVKNR